MTSLSKCITSTIAAIPVGIVSGAAIAMFLSVSEWDCYNFLARVMYTISRFGFICRAIIHDNIMVKFNYELERVNSKEAHNSIWRNQVKEVIPTLLYDILFWIFLATLGAGLYFS